MAEVKKEIKKPQTEQAPAASDQKAMEEAALKRVCAAMGVSYDDVLEQEKVKTQVDEIVEVDMGPFVVEVNGMPYRGRCKVTRGLAETLQHAAASKQMRILREQIGLKHEVIMMAQGGISSRVIGPVEGV